MLDAPSVSIVIPTFNRPTMLRDSVIGALAQTVSCEVVVVDHGSRAETRSAAEEFGSDITYVRRELDSGPIFAWLDGALHASGEFINLHFDDDLMEPSFVERCLELAAPGVGMVFTAATVFSDESACRRVYFDTWFPRSGRYSSVHAKRIMGSRLVSPCAALHRREVMVDALYVGSLPFQRSGYHGVGPDFLLQQLALLRFPEIGFVQDPLVRFRAHPGSITISVETENRDRFFEAYREVELHMLDIRIARLARRVGLTRLMMRWHRRRGIKRLFVLVRARIRGGIARLLRSATTSGGMA